MTTEIRTAMKTLLFLLILAGAMSAQNLVGIPELKIRLEGSLDVPMVVNNSGRAIVGYVLKVEDDTGSPLLIPVFHVARLVHDPVESADITPGQWDTYVYHGQAVEGRQSSAQRMRAAGVPAVVSRISLDSVVFSDMEFAGPDTMHFYKYFASYVDGVREFAVNALADMSRIAATKEAYHIRVRRIGEQMMSWSAENKAAEELYTIQQQFGIEGARQAAYRLSQLPRLWKEQK